MKHAERCVIFERPEDPAALHQALHDAAVSLPAGKMLVYWADRHHDSPARRDMQIQAIRVADRLNLQMVQWPDAAPHIADRRWVLALQKHSGRRND